MAERPLSLLWLAGDPAVQIVDDDVITIDARYCSCRPLHRSVGDLFSFERDGATENSEIRNFVIELTSVVVSERSFS